MINRDLKKRLYNQNPRKYPINCTTGVIITKMLKSKHKLSCKYSYRSMFQVFKTALNGSRLRFPSGHLGFMEEEPFSLREHKGYRRLFLIGASVHDKQLTGYTVSYALLTFLRIACFDYVNFCNYASLYVRMKR